MAQNINYGSEIKNGGTIKSEHVSQFVDAFTGAEAYDIDISGSLDVEGTVSGSFIGDGSGLTGLPTGSDGSQLTTKAGNIPSSSFQTTGSGDSFATVTFATPFSSSDYSVALEFEIPSYTDYFTKTSIVDKTPAGFNILTETQEVLWRLLPDSSINYIAVANTETSVFTIPTSSFGLNTKVGFVSSASFQDTGSDSFSVVNFATPFSSSDYSVALTYRDLNLTFLSGDNVYVNNKTTSSFTITSTLNNSFWGQLPDSGVEYIAVANGETAVTSSFTLLAATASYVEQAQTASLALSLNSSEDATINSLTVGKGSGSGSLSTAFGINALLSNTTGTRNTANGFRALQNNTTGVNNIGVGYDALKSNTTGDQNTSVGHQSLSLNISGSFNVAVGVDALSDNNSNSNTAVGHQALSTNVSGNNNVAVGKDSLYLNTTGIDNTAVGYRSLFVNTTGVNNTAIGNDSLYNLNTGSYNVALGDIAGKTTVEGPNNTDSENSIFIGYNTTPLSSSETNQIVIGHNADGLGSNTVVLGNDLITNTYLKGDVNTTTIITTPTTVTSLPSGVTGQRSFVTDSTYSNLFGEIVTGSGTYSVPVFYDGTNWRIG